MATPMKMAAIAMFLTVLTLSYMPQAAEAGIGDCYETWSRCSGWSSWATGILWKSCHDRCVEDFGKNGGNCVEVPSSCPVSDTALQCQCY